MKRSIFIVCFLAVLTCIGCSGKSAGTGENKEGAESSESQKQLTDREVLMLIFKSTNGENWSEDSKENWGSDLPLKEWEGVKTNEEGRVIKLSIYDDNITGSYPKEIAQLSELKELGLSAGKENKELQPFPASMGDMTKLEYLGLTSYAKDIVLPAFTKLVNLKKIMFHIDGKLPEGLSQLQKMEEFSFIGLKGDVPAEITKLTNLKHVYITGSELSGTIPSDIGNLKNLKLLNIGKVQAFGTPEPLKGNIPESLWELENLENLNLIHAATEGSLPSDINKLTKLKTITIIDGGLTGEIPKSLYSMTQLEYIELYYNKLTGTISPEIGNLTNLKTFAIQNNQFTGKLPATLGKLTKLKALRVQNNQLTGAIPAELANCELGGYIEFYGNQFSDNIAPALKAHPKFEKWKITKQ